MSRRYKLVFVALLLAGCSKPTPERQIVDDAVSAMGGESRIQSVRSLAIDGEGKNFNLGQDVIPDAATQTFAVTGYRRVMDVAGGRARTEQTRTPNFAYFAGPAAQRQVLGIDGETGYNLAANGTATRVAAAAAKDRRAEFYHHPLTLLRAALDPAAKLVNPRTAGGDRVLDVTTAGGMTFTLTIDSAGLPSSIASTTDQANLGDVVITTSFADYQDVNGLKLPATFKVKTDDFTTAEIRATKQTVDVETADLAAPAAAASAAIPAPAAPTIAVEQVGPGVWFLGGQSHHSVLAEFSDHLMLIEAPQSEARTLAVIAKARELQPAKPLTKLVMTHHHFDHSAGLRAAISEGLSVITQAGNRAFVEKMAGRAHTIQPDALAKSPKPLTVEAVDEQMVIRDPAMTVNLYHVAGNPHSDTMLMAYFPAQRVIVEVDAFSPGAAVNPYAANLLENITKRRLAVDRIVPLHGAIAPFEALKKAASTS
jgi:glyoxylase-like metal-dependent hydrolase (beta-lactamase superfamily II)